MPWAVWFLFLVIGCWTRSFAYNHDNVIVGSSLGDKLDYNRFSHLTMQRRNDDINQAAAEEYERIKYNLKAIKDNKNQKTHVRKKKNGIKTGRMGVSDTFCDDAKHQLETDWDPTDPRNKVDYICEGDILKPKQKKFHTQCISREDQQNIKVLHYCMQSKLPKIGEPPVIGSHRPLWAAYGEYTYIPWQRWLHNLEHGAVGLLYHKCADPNQVDLIRQMLTRCMRKHIITPYDLPEDKPLALVSWGCYLPLTHFDAKAIFDFIRQHSNDGREHYLERDGAYRELLTVPAKEISRDDTDVCPASSFPELRQEEAKEQWNQGMLNYADRRKFYHGNRHSALQKRDVNNVDEQTRAERVSRLRRDLYKVKELFFHKIKPFMGQ